MGRFVSKVPDRTILSYYSVAPASESNARDLEAHPPMKRRKHEGEVRTALKSSADSRSLHEEANAILPASSSGVESPVSISSTAIRPFELQESICTCDQTKQGRILKSFKARFRSLYTGSPVVDTVKDIDGYLAFLESDHWAAELDYNMKLGPDDRKSRYEAFKLGLKSDHILPGAGRVRPTHMDQSQAWYDECPSLVGLTAQQVQSKIDGGWICTHWPVGLKYNCN